MEVWSPYHGSSQEAGGNYRRNGTETRRGNKTLARVLKIYGSHVTNREVRRKMHELEKIV